jgi:hypothetical protein
MQPDLTLSAFHAWLKTKRKGDVVGQRVRCAFCPIATFLKEAGASRVLVGDDAIAIAGREIPLPDWAAKFNQRLDAEIDNDGEDDVFEVTAREALRVLASI